MSIIQEIEKKQYLDGTQCSSCPFFKYEDTFGDGYCDLMDFSTRCNSTCNYIYCYEFMNAKRAEKVLHFHQIWRRGGKVKMVSPVIIGDAIDEAIRSLRKQIKDARNKECEGL